MAIYNKRAKFTTEQLLDHYLKRNSITDLVYTILRVIAIIVQNLYCLSSYLVLSWLVLLPVNWIKTDLYSRLENHLYNSLLFIVSSWSLAAGITVVESGDEFKHLIEKPEKNYPEESSGEDSRRSRQYSHPPKKISNNKRYLDNLISSNKQNAFTVKNRLSDRNGSHAKPLNGFKNHLVEISKAASGHTNQSSNANLPNSLVKGTTNPTVLKKSMNKSHSTCDCVCKKDELTENSYDQDLLTTAVTRQLVIHNNNNISEKNHITACKNIHLSNGVGTHSAKDSALMSPCEISSNRNEIPHSVLKSIEDKPRILFLCNHISTADVPLIMQSFSTLTNQSILWVLDAQFKYTNFGVVCGSHGDFFVAKNSYADGSLRAHVLKQAERNLLVLFPEGGFLRKRIEGSNRYATRNNLPLTKYVTHPRFGAFKDLIDPSVGVTHIVDATLMYNDIKHPLSIVDILFGNKKEPAILHYKLYKRSEITPTEEWLRNIWLEKDQMLTKYYEDRALVMDKIKESFRVAVLDWFKILCVHLFFLLVCYLTMFRLFNATSVTMLKARELYYTNI